jgi:hypothetical protein
LRFGAICPRGFPRWKKEYAMLRRVLIASAAPAMLIVTVLEGDVEVIGIAFL